MIAVVADLGGEKLLGKARELADYRGVRVIALCSEEHNSLTQRYISLGADEVVTLPANNVGEWIEALVDLIKTNKQLKIILLPSNVEGDLILGEVSARIPERIGSVLCGVESLSEESASKMIPLSESKMEIVPFPSSEDRVSILSLKLGSFPEPYADAARYGKVSSGTIPQTLMQNRLYIPTNARTNSSDVLVILEGKLAEKSLSDAVNELATKYRAAILNEENSAGKVVYGNCLAIGVSSHRADLPQFNGDLVTINTDEEAPIAKLASLAFITQDIEGLVRSLL